MRTQIRKRFIVKLLELKDSGSRVTYLCPVRAPALGFSTLVLSQRPSDLKRREGPQCLLVICPYLLGGMYTFPQRCWVSRVFLPGHLNTFASSGLGADRPGRSAQREEPPGADLHRRVQAAGPCPVGRHRDPHSEQPAGHVLPAEVSRPGGWVKVHPVRDPP